MHIKNHLYNVNHFKSIVIDEKHVYATYIYGEPLVLAKGVPSELQKFWDTIVDEIAAHNNLIITEEA